eukprot:1525200-Amphidinium_carterae.1
MSLKRVGEEDPVWSATISHNEQIDAALVLERIVRHFGISCRDLSVSRRAYCSIKVQYLLAIPMVWCISWVHAQLVNSHSSALQWQAAFVVAGLSGATLHLCAEPGGTFKGKRGVFRTLRC